MALINATSLPGTTNPVLSKSFAIHSMSSEASFSVIISIESMNRCLEIPVDQVQSRNTPEVFGPYFYVVFSEINLVASIEISSLAVTITIKIQARRIPKRIPSTRIRARQYYEYSSLDTENSKQ